MRGARAHPPPGYAIGAKPSQVERRNLCWSTDSGSFEDPEFEKALNALELRAWHAFKCICSIFFLKF